MEEIIYLTNARLSFPHLVEPRASTDNPAAPKKYSADFIIEPSNPGFAQFMQRYQEMAVAKWGEHANQVMQLIQADRKLRCYGSGAEKIDKKSFQPYSGYAGMVFVAANKDQMPQMIQADGKPVEAGNVMAYQALARKMYGGCYVNVALKPWLQENKHGRGVRCDLVALQFAKDGEAFGEGVADASGMFAPVVAAAFGAATPNGLPGIPGLPSFLN